MERLSADDEVMLWPDALWPQEVGALAILDGGPLLGPDGRPRIEAVRAVVESRSYRAPRFRQLLYVPGRGLGGPLWIDAPTFDIQYHLRVVPVPAPGDEAALVQAVERLRRQRLDRLRPLWQMTLLPGLRDGRIGLFVKVHHAVADGIAAIATIGAFLDAVPDPAADPPVAWRPRPAPTSRELAVDNVRRHASRLAHALRQVAHPVAAARQARAAWPALRRDLMARSPAPKTSLNRILGPDRTIGLIRTRLDVMERIARSHRATVNDVLLSVIAGGLREILNGRAEPVTEVRIDVPVTLRPPESRATARGNLIGQMMVPLPVGESDPSSRLGAIAAETAVLKLDEHPATGVLLHSRFARRALLKLLDRNPVNVTSADLVGPAEPVYFAGARVLEVFPILPLMGNMTLGVGALSYAGQFTIAVIADRGAYPDLDRFVAGAEAELVVLAGSASRALVGSTPLKDAQHRDLQG
jgi:WS/DGAT/MGAT family acyltransferase